MSRKVPDPGPDIEPRVRLRQQWAAIALLTAGLTFWGLLVLSDRLGATLGGRWALLAGAVAAVELAVLWARLEDNRIGEGPGPRPFIGAANLVTVGRGLLLAALAGFLVVPRPAGGMAWVPAGLYATAVGLDFLDGRVARRYDAPTPLGSSLDQTYDAIGLVAASALAVSSGQLPAWFLLVGAAKPVYVTTLWVWTRHRGPLGPLPDSRARRPLAVSQMLVCVVALVPATDGPVLAAVAVAALVPFLAVFARDWLAVTGVRRR